MPRPVAELEGLVDAYVASVTSGMRMVGRFERLAVERHQRDLATGTGRGLRFNTQRARRALWWIEHRLRFSKGEWARRPFTLEGWQAFALWSLFGWERLSGDRWVRRFRAGY